MALDAVAVLDAEGVDRAHVMGASMGGVDRADHRRCCTRSAVRSLVLACTACRHHEWRRELLAGVGRRGRARAGWRALGDEALRLARRAPAAQAVRHLAQPARPDPAAGSRRSRSSPRCGAILDAHRRAAPRARARPGPDARHHRVAGPRSRPLGDAEELAELIPRLAARRGARAARPTASWSRRRTRSTSGAGVPRPVCRFPPSR